MSLQHPWSKPQPDPLEPNQSAYWIELRKKCIDALADTRGNQEARLMHLIQTAGQMAASYRFEEEGDRRYMPTPGPFKPWPSDLA